jgi:hypothetical protein
MRALKLFLTCLAAAMLAGCAGYRLGPVGGGEAGAKSVEVLPFNNQTLQPRLGDALTQALRERLQVDATFKLAPADAGDITVTGVIRSYHRDGLGYLKSDASTPQNFRIVMVVHVVARERATGKLLLDRDIRGQGLVNIGSDLVSSERQAAPSIAADVAQNIVAQLADPAW